MTAITPSLEHFHGIADDPLSWLRYEPNPIGKLLPEMTRSWEITTTTTEELSFAIRPHHHPYAAELTAALLQGSVAGLQAADTTLKDGKSLSVSPTPDQYLLYDSDAFVRRYAPDKDTVATAPVRELDFQPEGAYAVYNWELFYHVPMAVALHLSRNRRFAEAQRWLHYLFDPTDASEGPIERYWKVQPFQLNEVELIGEVLEALATFDNATPEQLALRQRTINAITAWRGNPFQPHLVARTRPGAYKVRTLMAYLDNLISWADSIFQQDTAESVDEAAMLYIRAAQLLGPRPQRTPARGTLGAQSYRTLRKNLDEFGNALRTLEAGLAFDLAPPASEPPGREGQLSNIRSIGQTLYFCVPGNEKLLSYWDTVADRLFKIRNSLNFQGVFRQLPLFDPPIDPALLARGVAAGLDIGAILAESHQPLAPMRFAWWSRQALELGQEARALGASLLQAMEREDADALAAMRMRHETAILAAMETVRYGQLAEARKQREGCERVIAGAFQRYRHFEQLLGRKPDEITLPEIEALDAEGLEGLKYKNSEPEIASRALLYDHVEGLEAVTGGHLLNRHEAAEILLSRAASGSMAAASQLDATAALFGAMPNFAFNGMFWGIGPSVQFGPQQIAAAVQSMAASVRGTAALEGSGSQDAARLASFTRREQEWANQSNAAAGDISLAFKQLRAAQIREAVGARELDIQRRQIDQAREIEAFLFDERSVRMVHASLLGWLRRETRGLYARALDFATATARKAQRAFEYELGTPGASYIQATYADGNEGLLAADRLLFDLRRMEVEFREKNRRELEVQEDLSLLQLAPAALVMLRTQGRCEVSIEESALDQRTPGHYFRRLKNVGVSIPCLTGPHTRVHCTLRLVKSSIRVQSGLRNGRYEQDVNDERFRELSGIEAAIVTSGAQNDDGLFAGRTGDERYLPFEGHGAISTWQLELPEKVRQFDYSTISDVVLHMQYTAREGIPMHVATDAVMARLKAQGTLRLFSMRHEFPNAWAALGIAEGTSDFVSAEVALRREHFPYWASIFPSLTVNTIDFYVLTEKPPRLRVSTAGNQVATQMGGSKSLFSATGINVDSLKQAPGLLKFDLHCPDKTDDVWFVVAWKVEE
jgi:hypothetical protein